MNTVILGAGGVLGRAICDELLRNGRRVIGIVRSSAPHRIHPRLRWYGLASGPLALPAVCDAVVDCRAVFPGDLQAVEQLRLVTPHWVHISSIYVYGSFSRLAAAGHAPPIPLREDSLLRPAGPYSTGKAACERVLLRSTPDGARLTILRIPFVIGRGDRSRRPERYLSALYQREPLRLFDGGRHPVELISSVDAASAIMRALQRSTPGVSIHNVFGGPCLSLRDHLLCIERAAGDRFVYGPPTQANEVQKALPLSFPFSIVIDRASPLAAAVSVPGNQDWFAVWREALEAVQSTPIVHREDLP